MKIFFLYIIICAFSLSANQVLAVNYQNESNAVWLNLEINSSQLSAAKLLQKYLTSYKLKINELFNTYESSNTIAMSTFNSQLVSMYNTLEDIQNWNATTAQAKRVISSVVSELKIINTRMKVFLEQEKILHEKKLKSKQEKLSKIWDKISKILDSFLASVSTKLLSKDSLSQREKDIAKSLIIIRQQNNKMKAFARSSFESESQMKDYISTVVSSIRNEFKKMKSL